MTYRIVIKKLDGSVLETEANHTFNPTDMKAYYTNPGLIYTQFVSMKCSPFSGDLEEVIFKEIKPESIDE